MGRYVIMKYAIKNTPISGNGHITILLGRGAKIVLDKKGGELTKAQVEALNVFKTADNKSWIDATVFVRLVKAGRLQITGDKELEKLFGTAVPAKREPKRVEKTPAERLAAMEAEMRKRDEDYVALKALVEKAAGAETDPPAPNFVPPKA